jgi:hypothetical protein
MRFSEDSNYRDYMERIAADDYSAARAALEACLSTVSISLLQKAFLLQQIGMTYFFENNVDQSLHYYALAEQVDLAALMPRYLSAKFFADKLMDNERAIAKCDEIIRMATASPFEKTEEDLGSDYYISKAEELKQFCYAQKAGK